MLVDHVTIQVSAGKGGKGAVAFSHIMMTLGPTGGSGGKGGDVYLEASADLGALRRFRTQKSFAAEDGLDGRSSFRDGRNGKDLVLIVPRGTSVLNKTTGTTYELVKEHDRVQVVQGGKGGKGNFQYKSSTNTSPKKSQPGLPGESAEVELELKLIADIGLIGLPNIGKSSFLNEITNAQSKVANYEFTTLEPHLGAYHTLILADIPGLIEGASSGKGLGIKFLRHIERTKTLFHFIDAGSLDALQDYKIVRKELELYNRELTKKKEYIIISKSDTVSEERLEEIIHTFKKYDVFPISIYNADQLNALRHLLDKLEKT